MIRSCVGLLAILSLFSGVLLEDFGHLECGPSVRTKQGFNLLLQSKKNLSGEWVTTFEANREMNNETDKIYLDLKHKIVECGEKQIFQIRGTFRDTPGEKYADILLFDTTCGKNVAVTNNGRTIQKLNAEDRYNSVAFTNRPLKINELFEINVDRKIHKLGYFMGIGVSIHSPKDIEIPSHMIAIKTGTWMLFHSYVFNNGTLTIKEHVQNLDKIQVGDRVGLKVSELGTLHLFVNGADLGPAASNIPHPVFGVFEFYGDIAQVTITRTDSTLPF